MPERALRQLATVRPRGAGIEAHTMRLGDRLCLYLFLLTAGALLALMIYTHTPWAR